MCAFAFIHKCVGTHAHVCGNACVSMQICYGMHICVGGARRCSAMLGGRSEDARRALAGRSVGLLRRALGGACEGDCTCASQMQVTKPNKLATPMGLPGRTPHRSSNLAMRRLISVFVKDPAQSTRHGRQQKPHQISKTRPACTDNHHKTGSVPRTNPELSH